MDRGQFNEHKEKEGWSDAEDESLDGTSQSLSFGNISRFFGLLMLVFLYV